MITDEQLRILQEQAKKTADKYIDDPRDVKRFNKKVQKAIRDDRYAIDAAADDDIPF